MWIALAAGTASRSSEGKNQSSGSKRRQSDHYRGDPAVPTLSLPASSMTPPSISWSGEGGNGGVCTAKAICYSE
jgi:hypothetical protein